LSSELSSASYTIDPSIIRTRRVKKTFGLRETSGGRDMHRAYDITALLLTYLLDRQGRIAASYAGVVDRRNVEANIATLLQERR